MKAKAVRFWNWSQTPEGAFILQNSTFLLWLSSMAIPIAYGMGKLIFS